VGRKTVRVFYAGVIALSILALATGCATNPVTGKKELSLISEEQEIAMGRDADKQISSSMGLYNDPGLQEYVQELGLKLGKSSERPDLPWSFKVIDDPAVNAFALPGGFIYVTRGILAHLNSEAELMAVLGHEVGHVTAKHGVNRMSKSQLFGLGLGIGSVVKPGFQRFADLAQQGLGLLFLKFSREDERQSDDLGFRYLVANGYDPREMPEVFKVLKAVGDAAGAGRVPNWLATHPDPLDRRERIEAKLGEVSGGFQGLKVERASYVGRLDNLVFGPNPREGFFEQNAFFQPDMKFRFDFPSGWKTQNQKQAVIGVSEGNDAAVQLKLAARGDPQEVVREFLGQEGLESGRIRSTRVNGLNGAWADFAFHSEETNIDGLIYSIRYDGNSYAILGYSMSDKWGTYSRDVGNSLKSFAQLTDRQKLNVQPARIDVVRANRSLTLDAFQQQYPSNVPLNLVGLINHIGGGTQFETGLDYKRVVGGVAH
jgi:predicted Zn-dependent protease